MNPMSFEKVIEGLSSDEILSTAIECGYMENKDYHVDDAVVVPYWLAQILGRVCVPMK